MGGTTQRMSTTPQEIMPLRNSIVDAFMSGNIGPGYGSGTPNMGNSPMNQSWMNSRREAAGPKPQFQLPGMGLQGAGDWMRSNGGMNPLATHGQRMDDWRGAGGGGPMGASDEFLAMLNANLFRQGPSLDSYADPNGALFKNVSGRYEDMFNTNRQLALAQAKESSGNLTGSGYAAAMGNVVNRSLGEQNATLGNLLNQLAMAQYGQEQSNAQNEAQRFMQFLMSMSGNGVGPDTIVQSGGPGALLGPLFSGIGFGLGGPMGAKMGGWFGGGAAAAGG